MVQNVSIVYSQDTSGASHSWQATYDLINNPSLTMVQNALHGNKCNPGDLVKIDNGYSSTSGGVSGQIKDESYTIDAVKISDWTEATKKAWYRDFIRVCGGDPDNYMNLFSDFENTDFNGYSPFELLSSPSLGYITTRRSEIILGLNSYLNPFVFWTINNGLPNSASILLSHAVSITWSGVQHITWSFSGIEFPDYTFNSGGDIYNGGGNIFTEIRFAGDGIDSHYEMIKDVDGNDPTQGECSGTSGQFCHGDVIHVYDNSIKSQIIYTDVISGTASTSGTSGTNGTNTTNVFLYETQLTDWTWWGSDFYNNIWYVADVTNPCSDYANIPISERYFPLMVWETWDTSGASCSN